MTTAPALTPAARLLVRLARTDSALPQIVRALVMTPDATLLHITLPELARQCGAERATVSMWLGRLHEAGLIERKRIHQSKCETRVLDRRALLALDNALGAR